LLSVHFTKARYVLSETPVKARSAPICSVPRH
jgi:hypothetical protein